MSAIWGMINFDRRKARTEDGIRMENAMKPYKIDRLETKIDKNIIMGCGHQYITAEARREQLPWFEERGGIYYTADCMLDNRQELLEKLSLIGKSNQNIPDGELLYRSYEKWGEKFTDYVIGIFTFVLYEESDNRCVLYTDHTGSRSLYYYIEGDTLYFSTIAAPILEVADKGTIGLDEKWMTGCEATYSPDMMVFKGLTPFQGIYQLEAGHYIIVESPEAENNKKIQNKTKVIYQGAKIEARKASYWNPTTDRKRTRLNSQEEYKALFLQTFQTCIRVVLRAEGNTGITLSSGLDSSSVACLAASMLQEENKKLYSFTSVPLLDYEGNADPYFIVDESKGVHRICEAYPGIVPEFVSCQGKNAFSEIKRLVPLLEFPYKSGQNLVWLDEIYEKASSQGCRIVLKGQYGNATISYGAILTRVYDDLCRFKWRSAYRELTSFCRKNHIPRKKAMKLLVSQLAEKCFPKCDTFEDSMAKQSLLNNYHIGDEIKKLVKESGGGYLDTRRQRKQFVYNLQRFGQLGAYDTKFGLIHGIIIRDPTKDMRMIQLCSSLPMECFVQNGVERAMVRQYMRGIVPDDILDMANHRGLQSADSATRISRDWNRIGREVIENLNNPKLLKYIEENKLEQLLEKLKDTPSTELELEYTQAMVLCSCSIFLNQYGKE